jgi:hypothetical protein
MSRKSLHFIFLTVCSILFAYAVYRDIGVEEHCYGSDLRNRVVGARIIRDGHSPYFYKWDKHDGIRYYDPDNDDPDHCEGGKLSVITATPFFHQLLYPLSELPQLRIFRIWLIIEYLILAGMTLFFLVLARTPVQKAAVLFIAILFLFTEAWYIHIYYGQYYLFIPFLAMLFYGLMQDHRNLLVAVVAGLAAISLILIRPNALLFFLPFLLLRKTYTRNYLIAFFIPVLLLTTWSLLDKNEYHLWEDYRQAVAQHTAAHLRLQPFINGTGDHPTFTDWEGIDGTRIPQPLVNSGDNENGNFFLLFRRLYKPTLGLVTLQILSLCGILGVLAAFLLRHRAADRYSMPQVAILGYCLYMISDLFSPIYRFQYYTVQWIFPLLLAAAVYDRRDRWAFLLLLTGLGLNVINIDWTGKEHSLGEYLMLAVLIHLSLSRKPAKNGLSSS